MKRIFLMAAIASAVSTQSFAQASFGIQVGGNLGFVKYEDGSGNEQTNDPRLGVLAGVVADVPLGPISFRPELNYIQKGFKNTNSSTTLGITNASEDKWSLNYVEVPLNFVYNLNAGSGKVFFGLGPNFGFGISGQTKSNRTVSSGGGSLSNTDKVDVKFDGKNDANDNKIHLKSFDMGADVLAGYSSAMGLTFNVGYTYGFSDISPNNNSGSTLKNSGLTFKVGYMFGGSGGSTKSKSTTSSSGM